VNGLGIDSQKEYGYRNGQLLVTAAVTTGWGTAPTIHDNPFGCKPNDRPGLHITELRDAINALRSHMSMSAYSWQYSATTSDYISANPIIEMRTALDQALGLHRVDTVPVWLEYQPVSAIHIQELRDRVLAAWTSGVAWTFIGWWTDQLGTPANDLRSERVLAESRVTITCRFGEELGQGISGRTEQQGYGGDNVRQKFTQKRTR